MLMSFLFDHGLLFCHQSLCAFIPDVAHYCASPAPDTAQGALPAGSTDTLLLPHVAARGSAIAPEPAADPLSPDEQVRASLASVNPCLRLPAVQHSQQSASPVLHRSRQRRIYSAPLTHRSCPRRRSMCQTAMTPMLRHLPLRHQPRWRRLLQAPTLRQAHRSPSRCQVWAACCCRDKSVSAAEFPIQLA
jgi:hypothetical protein